MPSGPIIKGTQSLVFSRRERRYDPTTRTAYEDLIYTGTNEAVAGAFGSAYGSRDEVRAAMGDDAAGQIVFSRALSSNSELVLDRYEIVTEFVEKEIWSSPSIIAEAAAYNATVASGERNYRKLAEDTAEEKDPVSVSAATYPLFAKVVRHLQNGVTGWEKEYIVLRRSRRIIRGGSNRRGQPAGQISIGDGSVYYSTAQLSLPSDIEFSVPNTATLSPSLPGDFAWGWRRRPSNSVIEGVFIDQQSEFILEEWSTLHYTAATSNATW